MILKHNMFPYKGKIIEVRTESWSRNYFGRRKVLICFAKSALIFVLAFEGPALWLNYTVHILDAAVLMSLEI